MWNGNFFTVNDVCTQLNSYSWGTLENLSYCMYYKKIHDFLFVFHFMQLWVSPNECSYTYILFLKSVIQTTYDVLRYSFITLMLCPKKPIVVVVVVVVVWDYILILGIRRKTIHGSVATCFCHGSVRKWKNFFNNGKCPLPFWATAHGTAANNITALTLY